MTVEAGKTPAQCALAACSLDATIEDLEVNDEVEYYFSSRDVSTVPWCGQRQHLVDLLL